MSFPPTFRRQLEALPLAAFVVILAGLVITLPLWLVERPPLQDLPQHVAAVRVLSSFWEPSYRFAEYFELTLGRTQYLTVYLLAAGLAKITGPLVATKLVLSAALVMTPYCLQRLLRAIGYSPWLALLSLPLVFNVHVAFGFLNFVAGIPLLFWGLELAVLELREHERKRSLWLGFVLLVTFLTHVVPFGLLVLCVGCLTPLTRRSLARQALVMLPSLLAALLWLLRSPAGRVVRAAMGDSEAMGLETPTYQPFGAALRAIPDWLVDFATADSDDRRLTLWLVLWLALLVFATVMPKAEPREDDALCQRARIVLGAIVPVALLAYVVLPTSNGFIWPICQRFPLIAALCSVFLLGRLRELGRWVGGLVCLGLTFLSTQEQVGLFRQVEATAYRGFDEVVAQIPLGSRVATLVFDRNVEGLRHSPLMHAAGWVQAERGGLVMFTFAEFPPSPFSYRNERRPPPVAPRWEWLPDRVQPDLDLTYYDYVLVHGWTGTLKSAQSFAPVASQARWSLWRRADREPREPNAG